MVLSKLDTILQDRGITVEELAVKAMMSTRSILNAKRGKGVSLNTGKRIAKVLKMQLDQLA